MVVDIHSRFLFETEVFSRRRRRTLSVDELCEQMRDAQAEAYGDGLDLDTRHPWMWAVKPHYYSSHFYNWPYTYGLLFGLGLYARYRDDADAFRTGYDELLSTDRHGRRRRARGALRDRRARHRLLGGQPRRAAGAHRRLRGAGGRTHGLTRSVASRGMPTRYDLTRAELAEMLAGEPRYRVEQVWRGLYEQLAEPEDLTSVPLGVRAAARRRSSRPPSAS